MHYTTHSEKLHINMFVFLKKITLTKYFPSGETLQSWLDCLKTSEKFMLRSQLLLHKEKCIKEEKAIMTFKKKKKACLQRFNYMRNVQF